MISVVIPAYNSEKAIKDCLESLRKDRQSYKKPYEIIVVDDGSTDNTGKAAKAFRGVRVLRQKNAGPAKARNAGARAARGSLVLFTDADCVADRYWIAQMAKPFADRNVAGVQGRYKTRQKGMLPRFVQAEIEQRYRRISQSNSIDFVGSYAAAYRKRVFLELKGFDQSFPAASGEDSEFSFRLGDAGYRMVFNPRAVVYHTHPASLYSYLKNKFYRGYWGSLLYKKHPRKRKEQSYKSGTYFYEIALTLLLAALIIIFLPISPDLSVALFVLLIVMSLPDSLLISMGKPKLILIAPFLVITRNISLAVGIMLGSLRLRNAFQ